jgi:CHAD domain-containing protein
MAQNVKWEEDAAAELNARRELPPLVSAYFASVREFLGEKPTPAGLHRLRLASKRLRYTLELFVPCYPAGLKERLSALKKLQDLLGEINDAVASDRLLRDSLKRQPELRKFLRDRAAEKAVEFVHHWKAVFDAPGQQTWWTDFLERQARAPRRAKAKEATASVHAEA